MSQRFSIPLIVFLLLFGSPWRIPGPQAGPPGLEPSGQTIPAEAGDRRAVVNIGNIGMQIHQLGYYGNLLSPSRRTPSCEFPLNSKVEHMFVGGIWVAAIDALGEKRVSVGADDTSSGGSGTPASEFGFPSDPNDGIDLISTNPLHPNFSDAALATQHFEYSMLDETGTGDPFDNLNKHVPLGIEVRTKVLAYSQSYAASFVIVDLTVENVGGQELTGVYMGWYNELSVGNTLVNIPGDETSGWNFYDDKNSFVAQGDYASDPEARVMYCYDADGDDGKAISWVGIRLLGVEGGERDVFSYRQWRFGDDNRQYDEGKYDFMSSGRIDRGNEGEGENFDADGNWSSMFSVGPWDVLLPGSEIRFTIAIAAGLDSTGMMINSQVAQKTFDEGFLLPAGPPSPVLDITREQNTVILRWQTGVDMPEDEYDPTLASPEYHRSDFSRRYDFQGYRIYRIEGEEITSDPFEQATLVAEFDRITWPDGSPDIWGFNTGLPPLTLDGRREFIDDDLRDGFSYWYSVTSYANRQPRLQLEEMESGFNENSVLLVPGSAPGRTSSNPNAVGVYPNPYRASSLFDDRGPGGSPAELGRNIYFTNVPARAIFSIYNVSGTLVDKFQRDDDSTGQVAWDMLSENTRAIAPGLYVFVVEDLDSGEIQRGKFVILK